MDLDILSIDLDGTLVDTAGEIAEAVNRALEAQGIARLAAAGVRLACTTNKELRHARRLLDRQQMSSRFDLVIGGDSLPVKKPDAGVLRHVVAVLGGERRRTAHVGDSHTDVMAARNAGVADYVLWPRVPA